MCCVSTATAIVLWQAQHTSLRFSSADGSFIALRVNSIICDGLCKDSFLPDLVDLECSSAWIKNEISGIQAI